MDPSISLRDLAAGKPMPQRRALMIVRHVLEALASVHASHKAHGGLRPDRVHVSSDDLVAVDHAPAAAADEGCEPYRAPELDRRSADPRADIYAAGAILFELLTGRPPFIGKDRDALRRLHTYAPAQTLAQCAPTITFAAELEAVVATALAKQPDRRYPTAREMIAAIDVAIAAVPVAPLAIAPAPRPQPAEPRADDSLVLYAQELARQRVGGAEPAPRAIDPLQALAQQLAASERSATAPEVPVMSAHESAPLVVPVVAPRRRGVREAADRSLAWLSTKTAMSRRAVVAALAAVAAAVTMLVVVAVAGRGADSAARPAATVDAGIIAVTPDAPVIDLDQRCERLGVACGHQPKHQSKITDECKLVAVELVGNGCANSAAAVFDCYEAQVCSDNEKIWAYSDLVVLADRRAMCVPEWAELDACLARSPASDADAAPR